MLLFARNALSEILKCEFQLSRILKVKEIYKCKVQDLKIESAAVSITSTEGDQKANKSSGDVGILVIENQVCHFLPKDLDKHFPKIYHLDVNHSGLKVVTADDMKMFPQLQHLFMRNNQIEVLTHDLLHHNPLLTFVNFNQNRIKIIDPSTFDLLPQLVSLSLEGNICVDGFAMQDEALREFKAEITRNCSQTT